MAKKVHFLHFNDVYNIESAAKEPVGGAARMATVVKKYREEHPLVFFSGDCLSPSIMSSVCRGKQMIPILNAFGVHAACLGNHDLDFGVEHFKSLKNEWNFPWLAANVIDRRTGKRLGNVDDSLILEWGGIKIGVLGLVEEDWLRTLTIESPEDLDYRDFVAVGRQLARKCRADGAELIVALTHMRHANDVRLLDSVSEIDIVLGGHDHSYYTSLMEKNRNLLIKSGTDFRDLTKLDVEITPSGAKLYKWTRLTVNRDVAEDPEVKRIVEDFATRIGATLGHVVGYTTVDLDGSYSSIRTRETNLGNFVCDLVREATQSDVCLINSGTFRSDSIHPKGKLTKRDLLSILPFLDEIVVLKLTGAQLLAALENGVSKYPSLEGRFPQVSGIRFAFNPNHPSGKRIDHSSVFINDKNAILDKQHLYTVSTKEYLFKGRDGYDMLRHAHLSVSCTAIPTLPDLIRHHFMKLEVLNVWKKETIGSVQLKARRFIAKLKRARLGNKHRIICTSATTVFDEVLQAYAVSPCIEGRIVQI